MARVALVLVLVLVAGCSSSPFSDEDDSRWSISVEAPCADPALTILFAMALFGTDECRISERRMMHTLHSTHEARLVATEDDVRRCFVGSEGTFVVVSITADGCAVAFSGDKAISRPKSRESFESFSRRSSRVFADLGLSGLKWKADRRVGVRGREGVITMLRACDIHIVNTDWRRDAVTMAKSAVRTDDLSRSHDWFVGRRAGLELVYNHGHLYITSTNHAEVNRLMQVWSTL